MAGENGNGKWQLAFWIVTGFIAALLFIIIPAIFANDCRVEKKVDDFKDSMAKDITAIKESVARIEGAVTGQFKKP